MTTTSPRWRRAKADTHSLRSIKADIARIVVASVMTMVVVVFVDLPEGVAGQVLAAAILLVSALAFLGIEFGVNLARAKARLAYDENARLRLENDTLRQNKEDVAAVRRLQEEQAALYREHEAQLQKKLQVQEAQFRVFKDIAVEEQKTGRKIPFEAMMARLDLSTKVATGDFSDKPQSS